MVSHLRRLSAVTARGMSSSLSSSSSSGASLSSISLSSLPDDVILNVLACLNGTFSSRHSVCPKDLPVGFVHPILVVGSAQPNSMFSQSFDYRFGISPCRHPPHACASTDVFECCQATSSDWLWRSLHAYEFGDNRPCERANTWRNNCRSGFSLLVSLRFWRC